MTTCVPTSYASRVRGTVDPRRSASFDGLTITPAGDGTTTISGPVVAPAALHGLISRLSDLGPVLLAVSSTA